MRNPTRTLSSVVLSFEALVVLFAALVAKDLSDLSTTALLSGAGGLAAGLILSAALLRSVAGYVLGSIMQLALIATALVVPAMAVVGVIFAGLWVAGLLVGRHVSTPRRPGGPAGYAAQP